ncbi:unnamed protein product [Soboliphyme baturini]|uniref:Secreted protein n=1 Tax=Soboliphyme baturini TaxID=241478 RepID=A0A183IGE5_9BILA|nr:unnamed protein product [Soboliphyme baturini]
MMRRATWPWIERKTAKAELFAPLATSIDFPSLVILLITVITSVTGFRPSAPLLFLVPCQSLGTGQKATVAQHSVLERVANTVSGEKNERATQSPAPLI